jgi:Aerotolerance regulator N-terminal/von Willebrand factor type A domain
MSFLAPLFLIGAAAIGLPIIFHLIRRSSRDRVPFSSLMFLLPTPPRVTRRSKLENVVLLLLRCVVISLLAFAFARPFFSKPVAPDPTARGGQKLLLLLDTSASMRRAGLWSQAKEKARSILNSTAPADQVACFTFDRQLTTLVSFDQWASLPAGERSVLVSKRLDETNPGWGGTRLGTALIAACELFEAPGKEDPAPKHIVLISDLQEGSRLDGLQGFEWPKGIQVTVEALKGRRSSNAGLQLASDRDDLTEPAKDLPPRVRISNASDSKREQFQVGWKRAGQPGFIGATIDAYVPPGQSRAVAVPRPSGDPAPDRVVLAGDDEDFDNTAYVVPPTLQKAKILVIGNDRLADPNQVLYYLKRAFQDTRSLAAEIVSQRPDVILTDKDSAQARLLVVTDILPEEQIRAVKSFLQSDKAVLMPLLSAALAPTLGRLIGQEGFGAEEATGSKYAMFGQIDFEHPLFAPFADPRYSDFTKIHFWKHRRITVDKVAGSRVLARFDNGDPALVEFVIGKGHLWVLTSGWQPEDSQLALSSKFVPLLYAMLEQSGAVKEQQAQFLVGDPVTLPATGQPVTIRKPDASEVTLAQGEKFTGTDQPGVYTVTSMQPPVSFAVNLAPEESRTAPLPIEELERLGVPLRLQELSSPRDVKQRTEHLQAAQLENRQKLWRWLIVAALVVLVVETWLAGRLTRGPAIVVPETS